MSAQDGGPAFPPMAPLESWGDPHQGMSLRDWFAGNVVRNQMQLLPANINDYQAQSAARWAYMVADAMLKARQS